MASLNKVFLIGNLTRDPELRYTPNGMAVANLRLAVNHRYRDKAGEMKQDSCFVNVVVWDKQAENCNQYLQKGRLILAEGRLQQRSWQDAEGKNRSVIEVRADRIVFLDGGQRQAGVKDVAEEVEVPPPQATKPPAAETSDSLGSVAWPQEDIEEQ